MEQVVVPSRCERAALSLKRVAEGSVEHTSVGKLIYHELHSDLIVNLHTLNSRLHQQRRNRVPPHEYRIPDDKALPGNAGSPHRRNEQDIILSTLMRG